MKEIRRKEMKEGSKGKDMKDKGSTESLSEECELHVCGLANEMHLMKE